MRKYDILLNINYVFFLLFLTGALLNGIVIKVNDNKMPVYSNIKYETDTHFSYNNNNNVNLHLLTDKFTLPFMNRIYSIGDILLISFGLLWIIFSFVVKYERENELKYIENLEETILNEK